MHIYFSGIGGAGVGPLALIAHQAGYHVSGSDKKTSQYTAALIRLGIALHIGQSFEAIAEVHKNNPIDWIVMSSAVPIEDPEHPELLFAKQNNIKLSKRDECLNMLLKEKGLSLVAVAGTHGKTTTTAMAVWMLQQIGVPVSYSIGAKISFGEMGHYDPNSTLFVYECDEFDKNFLSFSPAHSVITTVDWDHHEIYASREEYQQAFRDFIAQSAAVTMYDTDATYLGLSQSEQISVIAHDDAAITSLALAGSHNRRNAFVAANAIAKLTGASITTLLGVANEFPGSSRRFEKIAPNIYSDYAHTPEEIVATIQMAQEINPNFVVVYEPLTNRRQHYMKDQYQAIFVEAEKLYWLPSYLAREDPNLPVLSPAELISCLAPETKAEPAELNEDLLTAIKKYADDGFLVVCMAGGGGSSLDEFLRKRLAVQ